MSQKTNILSTRIDNRLVHGQVGITWAKTIGSNLIVVVDDEAAVNRMQQMLMESVARAGNNDIRFFTIKQTIDTIDNASEDQKIFIVTRTLETVYQLIKGGIEIRDVNVGNLHFERGKKQLNKKVYIDDRDIEILEELIDLDIHIYIQDVPGSLVEKITKEKLKRLA